MSKISKDLKKDADRLLPDKNLKENIRQKLFPAPPQKTANRKRGFAFAMSAVACVLVIAIALAVIFSVPSNDAPPITAGNISDTLFLIDINPSFEIVADKDGLVTSVTGVNSDARIVLLGKNYIGKTVYETCADIITTSVKMGYVTTTNNLVNILAYNEDNQISGEYLEKLTSSVSQIIAASGGTLVTGDGEEAKQKLIDDIIAAYGSTTGLNEKTVLELHRILKQYDITKEQELDRLEELWEEELEKQGFDDDTMEDIIDKWKEENLKPLGEELEEELESYIDVYEIKLVYGGMSERDAEEKAEEEEYRLTELGRTDRQALRNFIDEWWADATVEFYSIIEEKLRSDGKTDDEINLFVQTVENALSGKDSEERKELIAELIEEYYENLIEPEDEDFFEEFLEELFDD